MRRRAFCGAGRRGRAATLTLLPLLTLPSLAILAACGGSAAPGTAARSTPPAPSTAPHPSESDAAPAPARQPRSKPRYDYAFPVRGCRADYAPRGHGAYPATDIFTHAGCAFVAPVAGRVDEVSVHDRWSPRHDTGSLRGGRFVSVVGVDGVRYYGSHLRSVAPRIRPGVRVRSGRLLGYVGNSGNARYVATHLHFGISWPTRPGIWWVRRGEVNPSPYLDAWRRGGDASPAAAVAKKHHAVGSVPHCEARC